jgi:hypothetical protein
MANMFPSLDQAETQGLTLTDRRHVSPEHTLPSSRQILVTLAQAKNARQIPLGSRRSYHGGGDWSASLHVRKSIADITQEFDLIEIDAWPIESLDLYCVVFSLAQNHDRSKVLAALNGDRRINFAQTMNEFHGMLAQHYDDPLFDVQYGQYKEAVVKLHSFTRGENVRVGVIDSLVDTDHPDLKGQIKNSYWYVNNNGIDDQLHGTAVTGVIAAAVDNKEGVVGLAPNANLYVYGACSNIDKRTRCTSFSLAKALEQAIENKLDVLNISLAGPEDPLLNALIKEALRRSMMVIAASNVDDEQLNFPASLEGVHAVGESSDLEFWFARNEQLSTQAGGGYQFFYGTSIASAGVTGLATLMRSFWPAALADAALSLLLDKGCIESTSKLGVDFIEKLQLSQCREGAH